MISLIKKIALEVSSGNRFEEYILSIKNVFTKNKIN